MEASNDLNALGKTAPDDRSSLLFSMKHMQLHGLLTSERPIEFLGLSGSAKGNLGPFGARSRGVALPT